MIRYPFLEKGSTIGVTASSAGLPDELHPLLTEACSQMEQKGYTITSGETPWTQEKARSASAEKRAQELHDMMQNDEIQLIFPPWGGELAIEVLEHTNFDKIENKWVLGYSDVSLLLLAITLKTGIATAHGTNLVDLRGDYSDEITAMWELVLSLKKQQSITQTSSERYQKEWQFDNPSPHVFHLTEPTYWKTIRNKKVTIHGRLLGGCLDVIRHLIGTPYGDVQTFRNTHIEGEPVIWYLENFDMSVTELRRTLVQMKLAGWFEGCSGILFGRSPADPAVDDYTVEDVYAQLADELQLPVVYDIDCGHVPPQITFINGAHAEVEVADGKGKVLQTFI